MKFTSHIRLPLGAAITAAALLSTMGSAHAQPLKRDLSSYFIFSEKYVHLKDLNLLSPANIGVNCKRPNDTANCGILSMGAAFLADGSQAVGDTVQCSGNGANLFQLFNNKQTTCSSATIRKPPVDNFLPAVLDDLDADNTPSCGLSCNPDYGDLYAACNFPAVFPACGGADIVVQSGGDGCTGDLTPNNGRCDLGPGTYGSIVVRNNAIIDLKPGDYNVCSFRIGRNAKLTAKGANVNIADGGMMRGGGGSLIAQDCGDLTVKVNGKGRVSFGRHVTVAAKICGPESKLRLGNSNHLLGQFVGDTVTSDFGNQGETCGGRCTCIDSFSPSSAHVGDTVTLTSACDLTNATAVKICNIAAQITSQSPTEIKVTVPAGAAGACPVVVESAVGSFKALGTLTVN